MDMSVTSKNAIRILLEMRPALDGHAGIPQQTRLLFRGLSLSEDLSVAGLIQSSTHALGRGLPCDRPMAHEALPVDRQLDRLGRVIIMLEQKFLRSYVSVASLLARRLAGGTERLTRFDPGHFADFIWRRLFAPTLATEDFEIVTRAAFRVAQAPWTAMHVCALASRTFGCSLFPRLDTSEFDVMIAETPYPATVSPNTRLVVRYHDAIPLLMPHTISNRRQHQSFHYRALRSNVESGAWFACVSEATRQSLLSIFPRVEPRTVTIHNLVSHEYFDEPSSPTRVPQIIDARAASATRRTLKNGRPSRRNEQPAKTLEYLLCVGTIEPRKNHLNLLSAWQLLRCERFPELRLVLVGAPGWHCEPILQKYRPWIARGDVSLLRDVPCEELRVLYKHARATVCASFAEGFDLPGVEAMSSGGAVVASDISVHREIYRGAAEYFNPYSIPDLARALTNVLSPTNETRRAQLIELGKTVADHYSPAAILPKWQSFMTTASGVTA